MTPRSILPQLLVSGPTWSLCTTPKWPKRVKKGPKGPKMAQNDQKWPQNSKKPQNRPKCLQMPSTPAGMPSQPFENPSGPLSEPYRSFLGLARPKKAQRAFLGPSKAHFGCFQCFWGLFCLFYGLSDSAKLFLGPPILPYLKKNLQFLKLFFYFFSLKL